MRCMKLACVLLISGTVGCGSLDISEQCGNGYLTIFAENGDQEPYEEECDDGNTDDGDRCSSTCEIEDGYLCEHPPGRASECTEF